MAASWRRIDSHCLEVICLEVICLEVISSLAAFEVTQIGKSQMEEERAGMQRAIGIAFGIVTQVLFGYTAWQLFWFLFGDVEGTTNGSLWIDCLLAVQFCVPHSWLLLPSTKQWLGRWISGPFYGLFFCAVTCVSLLCLIACWQPSSVPVWNIPGWGHRLMHVAFCGSWLLMMYSISLTGLGYQTGWTTWYHWFRSEPVPRRPFAPKGAYHWLRHPVYLSFLGLIWFNPHLTLDRAALLLIWTVYIFVGSYLKDQRLLFYIGDRYREYQARVPGYPGMPVGPLAKVPLTELAPGVLAK